jgi:NAD+ synthetase
MRIALAQTNPTVGDLDGNTREMARVIDRARKEHVDAVVFPELAVCGYPPKDLLLQHGFMERARVVAWALGVEHSAGITLIFGCPLCVGDSAGWSPGGGITNSLVAFRDGRLIARYDKRLLPTYDVFDENRYFTPGNAGAVIDVPTAGGTVRVGLSICEDLWKGEDAGFAQRYVDCPDPVPALIAAGAKVVVNPSASPFVLGKGDRHRAILAGHARTHGVYVAAVNQVGGNDDLVFDGHGAVYDPSGTLIAAGKGFDEDLVVCDLCPGGTSPHASATVRDPLCEAPQEELAFRALVLGVRDYARKTGFTKGLLGLSGGIDSALTVVIASAALGAAHVVGVAMPGPYSSDHALVDAQESARRLGTGFLIMPIGDGMQGFRGVVNLAFASLGVGMLGEALPDLTEENLQSRLRGTMLMTLSNRTGAIVLSTGNKSEMAVGYATLYGDMNGGLAVLADVSKQLVYRMARWINANASTLGFGGAPIPARSIEKAPSAELRPNQTDQDSLPAYDVLDVIIARYVEERCSVDEIVRASGFEPAVVARVCRMIDVSEYKRKQAATGIKITGVAFGSGRRMPIAQAWRG